MSLIKYKLLKANRIGTYLNFHAILRIEIKCKLLLFVIVRLHFVQMQLQCLSSTSTLLVENQSWLWIKFYGLLFHHHCAELNKLITSHFRLSYSNYFRMDIYKHFVLVKLNIVYTFILPILHHRLSSMNMEYFSKQQILFYFDSVKCTEIFIEQTTKTPSEHMDADITNYYNDCQAVFSI